MTAPVSQRILIAEDDRAVRQSQNGVEFAECYLSDVDAGTRATSSAADGLTGTAVLRV